MERLIIKQRCRCETRQHTVKERAFGCPVLGNTDHVLCYGVKWCCLWPHFYIFPSVPWIKPSHTKHTSLCGAARLECCESCTVVIIRDTCSLLPPNVALSLSWLRLPRVLETFHWLLLYPVKTETHIHTVKLLVNNVATVVRHCLVLLRRNAGCVWGVKWYNALSDIVMQEYVV